VCEEEDKTTLEPKVTDRWMDRQVLTDKPDIMIKIKKKTFLVMHVAVP